MSINQETGVEAFTCTIDELIHGYVSNGEQKQLRYPIRIDTYQRDYVWSIEKVEQLIEDISEHKADIHYYLGSLLFHEKKEDETGLYIIDGQQRLTTLAILYYLVNDTIPKVLELSFESDKSRTNIRWIKEAILGNKALKTKAKKVTQKIDQVDVTIIVTTSQDQAFRFFDSQNTRGVRLSTTDLLKSYHLRYIKTDNSSDLREDAAKRWEKLQSREKLLVKNPQKDPAFELFERALWRIRNWTRRNFSFEKWETVLDEFEDNRDDEGEIAVFPGPQNRTFGAIGFNDGNEFTLRRTVMRPHSKAKYMPFLIQQPLYDGYFFFLYAERYSELLGELHKETSEENLVSNYITAKSGVSYYLKELLVYVALAYIDRFGKDAPYTRFLKLIMLWFLQARLERHSFRKESPFTMLRDKVNVFGLVEVAYDSRNLMERFRQALVEQADRKRVQEYTGVRSRYIDNVRTLLPVNQKWDDIKNKNWKDVYKDFKMSADG